MRAARSLKIVRVKIVLVFLCLLAPLILLANDDCLYVTIDVDFTSGQMCTHTEMLFAACDLKDCAHNFYL